MSNYIFQPKTKGELKKIIDKTIKEEVTIVILTLLIQV